MLFLLSIRLERITSTSVIILQISFRGSWFLRRSGVLLVGGGGGGGVQVMHSRCCCFVQQQQQDYQR